MNKDLLTALLATIVLSGAGPAQAQTGADSATIHVTVNPAGAMVSCDGVEHGKAPITIANIRPGAHLLAVHREGHAPAFRTVTLQPGERGDIEIHLRPLTGLVLIHSEPAGAEVEVNGEPRGTTPLFIGDLPLGEHEVSLRAPGYTARRLPLSVPDRAPRKVEVALTRNSATLSVDSVPPGAEVRLSGLLTGVTPLTIEEAPVGTAAVEISLADHEPYTETIRLEPGQTINLRATLASKASGLRIVSIPEGAGVFVDEKPRGKAPLNLVGLAPGVHKIRLERRGYVTTVRTVEIREGEALVEEIELEPDHGAVHISTMPAGVKVLLDGRPAGETTPRQDGDDRVSSPLELKEIPSGSHKLRLVRDGYDPLTVELTVEKGKVLTVGRKLLKTFTANYEVATEAGVTQGVLLGIDSDGNIKLETRRGVVKFVRAQDVRYHRPIKREP